MKCQRCAKQATLHITEVLGEERFDELHLCEDCAKKYLYEPVQSSAGSASGTKKGKAATSEAVVDDDVGAKQCEECGIKFVEFRNTGRLGCPHDYDSFRQELVPLLESIHGDAKHQGKSPRRQPKAKVAQAELSQMRKKLQQAVTDENYEEAARVRDRIKELEDA